MRGLIIDSLFERMRSNPDIFFLNADMGINLVERFGDHYPDRYANVGIAEQNLISVSAGLANLGFRPFAYTISNFLVHRCFEQIRNDVGLHHYPVVLLGTSTGYDNAPLGPTHHIVDEWGAVKGIPGFEIYCPSSVAYAARVVDHVLGSSSPAYIRIPKGEYLEPRSDEHAVLLSGNSNDVLLVSYGNPAQQCLHARSRDPKLAVLVINRLHPLDEQAVATVLACYQRVIVVEDHFPVTGLYGSLCELVTRLRLDCALESVAPTSYRFDVGTSSEYFFRALGMDCQGLLDRAEK